jgi:SAM-dependent methyltransferase
MTTIEGSRGYGLSATGRETAEDARLGLLEQLYDPLSQARRAFVQPGWRCLEVGAGRGSLARWMAEAVGSAGEVVATDVDTRYLERLAVPNLRVIRHDLLSDPLEVLEPGSYDLVSARLVLFWLRDQEEAVRRLVACLRPGGWLIDEDGDWGLPGPVDPSHPLTGPHDAVYRYGGWWSDRGFNPTFGRTLPVLFQRAGLVDIRHEAKSEVVPGDSPWARWWADSMEVVASQLGRSDAAAGEIGAGEIGPDGEIAAVCAPFRDPTAWVTRELLHACWGRRPIV